MAGEIFTEQALRTAVSKTKTEISTQTDQLAALKEAALGRVSELVKGNQTLSSIGSALNLQTLAITAAIQGVELSIFAVKNQIENLKDKRLTFDKERQSSIASFQIRTNREERELSKQERIMKAFFELVQKNPSFAKYLGMHQYTSTELDNVDFYSVIPYYKMSDALSQPIASTRVIDKQRTAISLFFKSALPEAIADIDHDFQTENSFLEFLKSAFKKENYLNDLRAPRFLMIALANLLWNLQHPVDPETGYPLSVERCIELCKNVGLFLNKLLNPSEKTSLQPLSDSTNKLIYYIRKVELLTKSLKRAYIEEHLYELNINDLTNNAHQTLRTLDTSVFELIYSQINPITQKAQPDTRAAEYLASTISYVHELLIDSPELFNFFIPYAANAKDTAFFNNIPSTLIDVLIIFIHSTGDDKDKLYDALVKNESDSAIELLNTLKEFDEKFISPIKEVSKKELDVSVFNKKRKEVARLIARRLVPLITLVLEDHRVEVNLPGRPTAPGALPETTIYTAQEQVKEINALANDRNKYYVWELSPFIDANKETESEIDKLPNHQYRFTEITKLLDAITEIVQNYRTFLQYKPFQDFLIKCLTKIKNEYNELGHYIDQIDGFLSKDKKLNRNMQNILGPMTTTITSSLEDFSSAFNSFEQIITAPDFTEQQQNSLSTKINVIHQDFFKLFGEDSGISTIANPSTLPFLSKTPTAITNKTTLANATVKNSEKDVLKPKQVIELRNLIINCSNSLSYQSRYGSKGTLLQNLLEQVDSKQQLTRNHLKQIIHDLARVTLSYRPSYFFQASYGETRSAKTLIAAIKNPNLNTLLPISELLLGDEIDPSKESNEEVIQRLRGMKVSYNWESSSVDIKALTAM